MVLENLLSELRRLEREKIQIPLAADERGYIDRECPAESCTSVFKVLKEDWLNRFRDEAVFCPRCGHDAPANHWWTTEQNARIREEGLALIHGRISNALHRDARHFNSTAPRGFVRMTMRSSGSGNARTTAVPIAAAAILEQTLVCDRCSAGYAVLGTAFFCPCCGHNSVEKMFDGAMKKVRSKLDQLGVVRAAVREAADADTAETLCQSVIEDSLQDCVVAFQHLAERLYVPPAGAKPAPQNVFQRLTQGSDLWRAAVGKGYDDWLTSQELRDLTILFQRRHLLAHRQGLVDEKYIEKSGDTTYRVGQRIVVTVADVVRLATIVEKIGAALRSAVAPAP